MENKENGNRNLPNEGAALSNRISSAKKEGATRGALIAGIVGLVVLIVAIIIASSKFRNERESNVALVQNQKAAYTKQLTSRDSIINDWLLTFDQIEKDLNTIKQKENIITMKSGDNELTRNRKEQILEDVKYVNTLLEENRKKIESLNAQLRKSGSTIKGLQTRMATLESTLKEYETNIASLKDTLSRKDFQIGQLNTRMTALETTVTRKDSVITNVTDQMNEAYLASGTYRELKDKGILSKEGGFLGLGRLETLKGTANDNLFSKVDIRQIKMIPVNSRDAKLVTNHPPSSYQMIREGDNKIAYIEIKNPEEFWKMSKYAVVELKR